MLGSEILVVGGFSLILNIVGQTIPYWLYFNDDTIAFSINLGLWKYCESLAGRSKCVDFPHPGSTIKAVQSLEILGAILIMAALVCLRLKQYSMKEHKLLPLVGSVSAIIACLLMIIGAVVFVIDSDVRLIQQTSDLKFHAGVVICIVAGILGIETGLLALVDKNPEP